MGVQGGWLALANRARPRPLGPPSPLLIILLSQLAVIFDPPLFKVFIVDPRSMCRLLDLGGLRSTAVPTRVLGCRCSVLG